MTTDLNDPLDPTEDLIITITPRTEEAEGFAELVAAEVASALFNLGAVDVTLTGEWPHPDNPGDRARRLKELARLAKAGVRVLVVAGDLDDGEPRQ